MNLPVRRRLRSASATLVALIAATGLAACGSSGHSSSSTASAAASAPSSSASSSSSGSSTATTVAASGATSGPTLRVGDQAGTGAQALLQAAGLLHRFPFSITFADFTSGPPILQAISAGALDIGNTGNAPAVFAAAGGAKIKIVGALRNAPSDVGLLVPKGSSVTSITQLKGKKIAVAAGSSADYHLLYELRAAGMTVHDVQLVYLQPAQGLEAFESGQVDAWDVWPPFIQEALVKGARALPGSVETGNYSYEIAADSSIADAAKKKEIAEYLKVLNQAHVWANTHSSQWAKTWAQATGLSASIMDRAAAATRQTPVPVDGGVVSAEQGLVSIFYAAGLIPKSYPFAPYTTSAFNSSVS